MRKKIIIVLLFISPIPAFAVSLFLGAYEMSVSEVLKTLYEGVFSDSGSLPEANAVVIFDVRLPRILLALLVGSALSASGVTLQAVCKNPLVSPYILGLSSGAAFGAAVAMTVLPATVSVQLSAFLFGLLAVFIAYSIARTRGETPTVSLVLAGVITGAMFSALLSILQFLTDPHRLSNIVYWLMGSFGRSDWDRLKAVFLPILGGLLVMLLMRWRLNILSLSDDEAKSAGLNVEWNRGVFVVAAALASASAVSVCGIVGWIGLMTPHIVRMLTSPDHRLLLPLSATFGASFMLSVDTTARCLTPYDLPVGIISTLAGVPFFAYLLKRTKGGGWS